jgi:hypothetical protein
MRGPRAVHEHGNSGREQGGGHTADALLSPVPESPHLAWWPGLFLPRRAGARRDFGPGYRDHPDEVTQACEIIGFVV